ncbi:MAG: tetratricopeptide repeat protein [Gallionella sp.]
MYFSAPILLLIAMLFSSTAMAAESLKTLVNQAQQLVQAKQYNEAYALLAPVEFDGAGELEFDYWLGVSAVQAGKADRATVALERVAMLSPNYAEVRMWLGIAYFQMNDTAQAQQSFLALLQQPNLAASSVATAQQYLAVIAQRDAARLADNHQTYVVGALATGMGYDSNITIASNNLATHLPAAAVSGNFAQLNANLEVRKPFGSPATYGFFMLDSNNKNYPSHSNFTAATYLAKTGLNWQAGLNTYRFDLAHKAYRQEGASFASGIRNDFAQNSLSSEARLGLSERDFLTFSLQYHTPRFATQAMQDTNQIVLANNYLHVFAATGAPLIYIAYNLTRDQALHPLTVPAGAPVLSTDVTRMSRALVLYTQYSVVEDADLSAMWMMNRRQDNRAYARSALEAYGRDDMRVMSAAVNWRMVKNWQLKPQVMSIQNSSNIAGYAFSKTEVSLMLKREFK